MRRVGTESFWSIIRFKNYVRYLYRHCTLVERNIIMTIEELMQLDKLSILRDYQTTYLILQIENINYKIDFTDKKEFRLRKGDFGKLKYLDKHPLLLDYNEKIADIYINSIADNAEILVNDIKDAIDSITLGWRNWKRYLTNKNSISQFDVFLKNIKNGNGKLLEVPISIIQRVVEVCNKHNVLTKTFAYELRQYNHKLILINDDYVIAKEFSVDAKF